MTSTFVQKTLLPALCGAVGGFIVLWGGIALTLTGFKGGVPVPEDMWAYCGGTAIFMAIGAVLVLVSREPVLIKALAIGMSLPGFIKTSLPSDAGSAPTGQSAALFTLNPVGAAHAQTVTDREILLGGKVDLSQFELWFVDPSGKLTMVTIPPVSSGETASIAVPSDAVAFAAKGPEGWSATENLPDGAFDLSAFLDQRSAFSQSFSQAIGGYSGPYDLDLKMN